MGITLIVLRLLLSDAFHAFERAATSFFGTVDTHITRFEPSPQAYATPLFSIPQFSTSPEAIPSVYIDTTAALSQ